MPININEYRHITVLSKLIILVMPYNMSSSCYQFVYICLLFISPVYIYDSFFDISCFLHPIPFQ